MLVITKRSTLGVSDPKDIMKVMNLRLHYVIFDTPVVKVLARMTDTSKAELRRKIKAGAIYIGDNKIEEPDELWDSGNVGCFVYIGKEIIGILMPLRKYKG